ncbi:MAG: hypothetical protein AAFO06_04530 [Cyanobacteria bacterium J06597_16]
MSWYSSLEDIFTGTFSTVLKVMGFQYPLRTGLGVCLGIVIEFGVDLAVALTPSDSNITLDNINPIGFCALGLVIIYSPLVFEYIKPGRQEVFGESEEKMFALLARAFKDAKMDPMMRLKYYVMFIEKALDRYNLEPGLEKEMKKVQQQILQEDTGQE